MTSGRVGSAKRICEYDTTWTTSVYANTATSTMSAARDSCGSDRAPKYAAT